MRSYPILGTIGIELEVNDVPFKRAHEIAPAGWEVDDDGSNRTHVRESGGLRIVQLPDFMARNIPAVKFGAEFVSPPTQIDGDEYHRLFRQIGEILRKVQEYGECVTDLTSVHVHVHTGTPSLNIVHNMIWLWQALEAPMYRLSVAEHDRHRGVNHHSYMYCRPLSAPQIVKGGDGHWYKAFSLDKLMANAKTSAEFVQGMCRADVQPNKWQPFRYYGLNLGNYFNERQTTEFRVFNQTLQLGVIRAWVELCVAFVRVAYMDRLVSALSPFPLGRDRPVGGGEFGFADLLRIIPVSLLSNDSWSTLEHLWNNSMWQDGAEDQINHLCRDQGKRVHVTELPKRIQPERVDTDWVESELWNKFDFKH